MAEITLRDDFTLIIDDALEYFVRSLNLSVSGEGEYAYCMVSGKSQPTSLHRVLSRAPKGMIVDHKNRNTRDNRLENLRICTSSQNAGNRGRNKNATLGFKGLERDTRNQTNQYRACVKLHGKKHRSGYFPTPYEAAMEYDRLAVQLHGEFACTNKMLGLL
jgi:hypothetical protein